MEKYKKKVDIIYFNKTKKTNIDEVPIGEYVYLKVNSPLNYGIREWDYYGKIIKRTNCYFDILELATAEINNWNYDQIKKHENGENKSIKRWAKKSIVEIYLVDIEIKNEIREYCNN